MASYVVARTAIVDDTAKDQVGLLDLFAAALVRAGVLLGERGEVVSNNMQVERLEGQPAYFELNCRQESESERP